MAALNEMQCEACRAGAPTVTDAEITELKPQIPDWEITEVDGIPRLQRVYAFKNFADALAFTNSVGEIAEAAGHSVVSAGSRSPGGRTRSKDCIATTSSWQRSPISSTRRRPEPLFSNNTPHFQRTFRLVL